jgi:hypothetical protein
MRPPMRPVLWLLGLRQHVHRCGCVLVGCGDSVSNCTRLVVGVVRGALFACGPRRTWACTGKEPCPFSFLVIWGLQQVKREELGGRYLQASVLPGLLTNL